MKVFLFFLGYWITNGCFCVAWAQSGSETAYSNVNRNKHQAHSKGWLIGPKIGGTWQPPFRGNTTSFFGEASLLVGKIGVKDPGDLITIGPFGYRAASIGVESNLNNIYAPKIGAEFNFLWLGMRSSVLWYTKEARTDARLLVEMGISLWGYANFLAGWSIPLGANQGLLEEIGQFRVSLSSNLVFW